MPGQEGEDDPTRILRFDISAEIAQPQGDLKDRQSNGKAIRVGWLGANANKYFSIGGSFRFVATEVKTNAIGFPPDRSELFFDLVGLYLRLAIPLVPQVKGFIEADPALVGMHVPCDDPASFTCNGEGFEFKPRFGITGRVGGIYEVSPGHFDVYAYGALEKTVPDEGGWMSFGVGITLHYGPKLADIRRRQQWQQQQQYNQQYQQQRQWEQQQQRRPSPPPPPPPPPPS